MIKGAHIVIIPRIRNLTEPFVAMYLKFSSVDAGHDWLIFVMPPLEAAFHDSENNDQHELYLMPDDIAATLKDLKSKNVNVSDVSERPWGKVATFTLPGGGKIGVYEPKHPAIEAQARMNDTIIQTAGRKKTVTNKLYRKNNGAELPKDAPYHKFGRVEM